MESSQGARGYDCGHDTALGTLEYSIPSLDRRSHLHQLEKKPDHRSREESGTLCFLKSLLSLIHATLQHAVLVLKHHMARVKLAQPLAFQAGNALFEQFTDSAGYFCTQGRRLDPHSARICEDAAGTCLRSDLPAVVAVVLDGHGGSQCAQAVMEALLRLFGTCPDPLAELSGAI